MYGCMPFIGKGWGWKGTTAPVPAFPTQYSAGQPDASYWEHESVPEPHFWRKGGTQANISPGKGGTTSAPPLRWFDDKQPPFWQPKLEQAGYPFATWLNDINLWLADCELSPELVAPAVARRLGG